MSLPVPGAGLSLRLQGVSGSPAFGIGGSCSRCAARQAAISASLAPCSARLVVSPFRSPWKLNPAGSPAVCTVFVIACLMWSRFHGRPSARVSSVVASLAGVASRTRVRSGCSMTPLRSSSASRSALPCAADFRDLDAVLHTQAGEPRKRGGPLHRLANFQAVHKLPELRLSPGGVAGTSFQAGQSKCVVLLHIAMVSPPSER
jgi:hypothetical protein